MAPWSIACTVLLFVPDPSLASSIAASMSHRSAACIIHRCFYVSLIHRLHHSSLRLWLSDQSLVPFIAPSMAFWSIACTIHHSVYVSLINRVHHPSLHLWLLDPSRASSIASSMDSGSVAYIIHHFIYDSQIHRMHHPSLRLCHPDPLRVSFIVPSMAPWSYLGVNNLGCAEASHMLEYAEADSNAVVVLLGNSSTQIENASISTRNMLPWTSGLNGPM